MQNRNFNDLYAFTQVVKLGNFSRAAQSLGVQPSALSHRMNDLENRLNTKLLNRTTRSMSPTEAGQRLYERIAPMFGGIQCVACILMHDQITHGTLFNSFGHSRFRATSCTLRFLNRQNARLFIATKAYCMVRRNG